jgi:hypothetical protein
MSQLRRSAGRVEPRREGGAGEVRAHTPDATRDGRLERTREEDKVAEKKKRKLGGCYKKPSHSLT